LLLTEADTSAGPAATTTAATETFGVTANGRNLTLLFHQDFVEVTNRFIQLFAQARSTLGIGFAGIFTNTAGSASTSATAFAFCSSHASGTTRVGTLAGTTFAFTFTTVAPGLAHATYATGKHHTAATAIAGSVATSIRTVAAGSTGTARRSTNPRNLDARYAGAACRTTGGTTAGHAATAG